MHTDTVLLLAGCCEHRLRGFRLEAFNEDSQRMFSYNDPMGRAQDIYTVKHLHQDLTSPVKVIRIFKSQSSYFLTLCEVMVFGGKLSSGAYVFKLSVSSAFFVVVHSGCMEFQFFMNLKREIQKTHQNQQKPLQLSKTLHICHMTSRFSFASVTMRN